jgi:hypothetical protein
MFREWVCLDHPGEAGQISQAWWRKRFEQKTEDSVVTVNEAIENLFLTQQILEWTKTITIKRNGKFWEIVAYNQPHDRSCEIDLVS